MKLVLAKMLMNGGLVSMKIGLVLMIAMMMLEDVHYLSAAMCQLRNSRTGQTITNLSTKLCK